MNAEKFINFLYLLIFEREADADGLKNWSNELRAGKLPIEIFNIFLNSEEFKQKSVTHRYFRNNVDENQLLFKGRNRTEIQKEFDDSVDLLDLINLEDDWARFAEIIRKDHLRAKSDSEFAYFLETLYLEEDRVKSFDRFLKSYELKYSIEVLRAMNVENDAAICEVGGGNGAFSWGLMKKGFNNLHLFEPNGDFITGTGYLKSREDSQSLKVYNDLHAWHDDSLLYETIISKACIHHFGNISMVAGSIRQKMKMGGLWFAFREWFADSPSELANLMTNHPYCQQYKLYEWPSPASIYVESFEMVGLELIAIVPEGYADNSIATHHEIEPSEVAKSFTEEINDTLRNNPEETVNKFWKEYFSSKTGSSFDEKYSKPQVMIFRKVPVSI